VTLPFALLLLDFWPLRRLSNDPDRLLQAPLVRRAVLEKLGLLPLVIATSAIAFLVQLDAGAMSSVDGLPVGARVANAFHSYASYLGKAFWPAGLGVFYPHPGSGLPPSKVVASLALVLAVSGLALREARRRPWWIVGWLWFLGTLVPMLGLVQVGIQAMADRYMYIPLVGVAIAVAWGSVDLVGEGKWARRGLAGVAAAVSVAMGVVAWHQVGHWRDTIDLFAHTLRVTEKNAIAHRTLGFALLKADRTDEAIAHLRMAVSIEPGFAEAHHFLGNALARRGSHVEAVASYQRALRGHPSSARVRIDLADSLIALGRNDEAERRYRDALARGAGRDAAAVHIRLARLLADRGEAREAVVHYEEALRLSPELAPAREELARLRDRRS
jgi:Tfp pilus assembly protein PilF